MTKLMEWLGAFIAFLAVYLYLITGEPKVPEEMMLHIKFLPIYFIGMFGVSNTIVFHSEKHFELVFSVLDVQSLVFIKF